MRTLRGIGRVRAEGAADRGGSSAQCGRQDGRANG